MANMNKGNMNNTQAGGIIMVISAVLSFLSLFGLFGSYGDIYNDFVFGLLGQSTYAFFLCLLIGGVLIMLGKRPSFDFTLGTYFASILYLCICVITCTTTKDCLGNSANVYLTNVFDIGEQTAGGLFSGLLLCLPLTYIGYTVTLVLLIALLCVLAFFAYRRIEKLQGIHIKSQHVVDDFNSNYEIVNTEGYDEADEYASSGSGLFIHNKTETQAEVIGKGKKRKKAFNPKYINEPLSQETLDILEENELLRNVERIDRSDDVDFIPKPIPTDIFYSGEQGKVTNDTIGLNDYAIDGSLFANSGANYSNMTYGNSNVSPSMPADIDYGVAIEKPVTTSKPFGFPSYSNTSSSVTANNNSGYNNATNKNNAVFSMEDLDNVLSNSENITITNNDLFDDKNKNMPTIKEYAEEYKNKNVEIPKWMPKPKMEKTPNASVFATNPLDIKNTVQTVNTSKYKYNPPPTNLLKTYSYNSESARSIIESKKQALETMLAINNLKADIVGVVEGPSILRFELAVGDDFQLNRLDQIHKNLELKLTSKVNILSPIPNKPLIGIEIENPASRTVGFREMIEAPEFKTAKGLAFALGRNMNNKNVFEDITSMPHMLVAGMTGSGKSVTLNNMLCSLLYRFSPEELQFIIVDPKRVEFVQYNGLPHMKYNVIVDVDKAVKALNWAIKEMNDRLDKFASKRVRNIQEYNDSNPEEHMPYIIILIDELGDIMISKKNAVEDLIVRLAQMARAAGIHLVLAMQRPTRDVCTGNIKSNCPAKIALSVDSMIDSRVIIDQNGAEKLFGHGDMLYKDKKSNIDRLQAPFLSTGEIQAITDYIREHNKVVEQQDIQDALVSNGDATSEGFFKELQEANFDIEVVKKVIEQFLISSDGCSISMIQRKSGYGFNKAGKLMDALEAKGIVSPPETNQKRRLLITREQYLEMFKDY